MPCFTCCIVLFVRLIFLCLSLSLFHVSPVSCLCSSVVLLSINRVGKCFAILFTAFLPLCPISKKSKNTIMNIKGKRYMLKLCSRKSSTVLFVKNKPHLFTFTVFGRCLYPEHLQLSSSRVKSPAQKAKEWQLDGHGI